MISQTSCGCVEMRVSDAVISCKRNRESHNLDVILSFSIFRSNIKVADVRPGTCDALSCC